MIPGYSRNIKGNLFPQRGKIYVRIKEKKIEKILNVV